MEDLKHWIYWKFKRVDMQVSVFMAIIVLFSSLLVYAIGYTVTYDSMIESLRCRVIAIHRQLEKEISPKTFFDINTKEDMTHDLYKETKLELEKIKRFTDVMYLYTAKATENGDFIYIIDGLDEEEDFRYPGDIIEREIYPDMNKALANTIILPDNIKETEWGKIFITYFPFHDETGKVIGVIGIEIGAENQYDTYRMLRILTPISIIIFSLISVGFAVRFFRHISNPNYQDMLNTDQLTKLKNRNSFEINMSNMISMNIKDTIGIVVIDLDNLKKVNDILGHEAGDQYICEAAQAIQAALTSKCAAYRTGGDEFAIIAQQTDLEELEGVKTQAVYNFFKLRKETSIPTALSLGIAMFDKKLDEDIRGTYRRADVLMYEQKKVHRAQIRNLDV